MRCGCAEPLAGGAAGCGGTAGCGALCRGRGAMARAMRAPRPDSVRRSLVRARGQGRALFPGWVVRRRGLWLPLPAPFPGGPELLQTPANLRLVAAIGRFVVTAWFGQVRLVNPATGIIMAVAVLD